jgi:hypothetical protein
MEISRPVLLSRYPLPGDVVLLGSEIGRAFWSGYQCTVVYICPLIMIASISFDLFLDTSV